MRSAEASPAAALSQRTSSSDTHAVDEIFHVPVHPLGDESMDIRRKTREAFVEVARELEVVDDRPVEALAWNEQRDPRRIRREQHARHTALEFVDRDAIDLAVRELRERVGRL